ncbi:Prolamin_like domain-containing protein [Cephalotus follicularis]|uniref:Prolamin_like domain-containing protein n=1 Tax=Cephalotus follicularis TaxID=3775 RepID=A0A1Q3B7D8_CEPFO|nr:Prolamin_like domain-containing protein [Cephalotus follicularis]
MGKLNMNISAILVLFLASGILLVTLKPTRADSVSKTFVSDCEKNFTQKCGIQVYDSVYKTGTLSKDCCIKLVAMGRPCHDALVKQNPEFKANPSKAKAKSDQVWNACVSPSPPPK